MVLVNAVDAGAVHRNFQGVVYYFHRQVGAFGFGEEGALAVYSSVVGDGDFHRIVPGLVIV